MNYGAIIFGQYFPTRKMSDGGLAPTTYNGKTAKEVWKEWNPSQRLHFIVDHTRKSHTPSTQEALSKRELYTFLPKDIKEALEKHVSDFRYAEGGTTKGKKKTKKSEPKTWQEIALDELREESGYGELENVRSISSGTGFEAEEGNTSYIVFESFGDAEAFALDRVIDDLENEPSLFTPSFLEQHYYITDTDRRIMANEQADRYVEDIEGEDDGNRVVEEAGMTSEWDEIKEKISDAENADEDTGELEKEKDRIFESAKAKVSEDYYDTWYDGLGNPIEFLVEEQGIYSREDVLKASFMQIDTDEASKDAVNTDGVGHFLGTYSGEQVDLPSGAVAYRTN